MAALRPIPEEAVKGPSPSSGPPSCLASKIWFARTSNAGCLELLSFIRSDSSPEFPQFDTFGGGMDPVDRGQFHLCALRELREEAVIPKPWHDEYAMALASFPEGHRQACLTLRRDNSSHTQAMWLVPIPHDLHYLSVRLTKSGTHEVKPDSLRWRPADSVTANLFAFPSFAPLAAALSELLLLYPDVSDA